MNLVKSIWTAPTVERLASTLLPTLPSKYLKDRDFQLLSRESGSERRDLPIWVSTPHTIRWSDTFGPVARTDVPGVQGAFVLSNVLSVEECTQLLRLSEAMGYTEDAPVSLGRHIRRYTTHGGAQTLATVDKARPAPADPSASIAMTQK